MFNIPMTIALFVEKMTELLSGFMIFATDVLILAVALVTSFTTSMPVHPGKSIIKLKNKNNRIALNVKYL